MIDGTKVPTDPQGRSVNPHDPANWMTYEAAAATGRPVAFSLQDANGWFFFDLDQCDDGLGGWKPEAAALFTAFPGAWGEVSSSGRGLHIMGRCNPLLLADRKRRFDGWKECYTGARFIAFGTTGWSRIGGVEVDYDHTATLLQVVPQKTSSLGSMPEGVDPTYTGPADDTALLAKAMGSGSAGSAFGMKASFRDLWNADVNVLSRIYPGAAPGTFDHSAADASLMAHLAFWTGKDMPRMDRLFRQSKLMRDKYETRHDYREETIANSVMLCRKVYDQPAPAARAAGAVGAAGGAVPAGGMYLTTPEMQVHFKGCVYVRDAHKIMIPDGIMLKPEQFNATYGGHMFQMQEDGMKPTAKAFEAFTENRADRFPRAIRPCFRPDLEPGVILPDGSVNIYAPADVVMTPGDVTPFTDLLVKLLPDGRDRAILINYMAAVVQYPGIKFQWAPVLQGCEGNGKTLVFSTVGYAVGRKFTHSPKPDQLGNQFNSYLEGKMWVLVEEVHMQGKREMLDALKPLITNVEIEVEGKGENKRMIENRANWGFCTNHMDAILKSESDRRYAIFFTAQQHISHLVRDGMGGSYFPQLYDWLRAGGGYAAVAYWLKNWPIDPMLNPAGLCHRAPETSSTKAAISAGTGTIEREVLEATQDNTKGFRDGWISSWALAKMAKERNFRVSLHKLAEIATGMGYVEWGRAPRPILEEDAKRPVLYRIKGVPGTFDDYLRAQGHFNA